MRADQDAHHFAVGRFLESLLFELAPTDGLTIAQAVALMLTVGALASYRPARRAALPRAWRG